MVPARKRPKPGERREQILQALAYAKGRGADRIATAALAAHLSVSEVARCTVTSPARPRCRRPRSSSSNSPAFTLVQQIVGRVMPEAAHDPITGVRTPPRCARCCSSVKRIPAWVRGWSATPLFSSTNVCRPHEPVLRPHRVHLRQCLHPAAGAMGLAAPTAEASVAASVLTSLRWAACSAMPAQAFAVRLPSI